LLASNARTFKRTSMKHKRFAAALAAILGISLLGAAPAQASNPDYGVTIWKIGKQTVKYNKPSITLKPGFDTGYYEHEDSATLTVKKGKKTVAKNMKSVKLKPGKYRVTTTVKYRTTSEGTQEVLAVPAGGTITNDFAAEVTLSLCDRTSYRSDTDFTFACNIYGGNPARVNFTDDDILAYRNGWDVGDVRLGYVWPSAVRAPVNITHPKDVTTYSQTKTKTRTQTVKVKKGKKPAPPAKCATYSNYQAVYDGDTTGEVYRLLGPSKVAAESGSYQIREYKGCKKYTYFSVSFADNKVVSKAYAG
jgi:hypothetical protein